MLTLFRCLLGLLIIAFIAYFVFFVQFGEKTLYQHLVQISKTKEAQVLEDEIKKKAQKISAEVKDQAQKALNKSDGERSSDAGITEEGKEDKQALKKLMQNRRDIGDEDRRALKRLVRKKMRKTDR
jgi:hypothetical protein